MIDIFDLTKPWTKSTVEEWFLFGICVAGKGAQQTQNKLHNFLEDPMARPITREDSPFIRIHYLINRGLLGRMMRKYKLGQYTRINKAFRGMVQIDPATVTLEQLEAIHGVGPKTARMLLLYTRPGLEVIPLDTHVLKWLRANGYNAPKSTPSAGPKYRELEAAFIAEGRKRNLSPKEWDTIVWKHYAVKGKSNEAP